MEREKKKLEREGKYKIYSSVKSLQQGVQVMHIQFRFHNPSRSISVFNDIKENRHYYGRYNPLEIPEETS